MVLESLIKVIFPFSKTSLNLWWFYKTSDHKKSLKIVFKLNSLFYILEYSTNLENLINSRCYKN